MKSKTKTIALTLALSMMSIPTFGRAIKERKKLEKELKCHSKSNLAEQQNTSYGDLEDKIKPLLDNGSTILLCLSLEVENPNKFNMDKVRAIVEIRLRRSDDENLEGFYHLFQENKAPFGRWRVHRRFPIRKGNLPNDLSSLEEIADMFATALDTYRLRLLYRYKILD